MVKYPDKVKAYNLPSIDQMKQLLYDNDIGYKTQEDKMFIRRYYLLPQLTFPLETMATTISSDKNRLRQALDKEHSLWTKCAVQDLMSRI